MIKKMLRAVAVFIVAAALFLSSALAAPIVSAQCAVLMDAETGRILFEKNSDRRALIASTTKIMTGLIIAEECSLNAEVLVTDEAAGIEGSSLYLRTGEKLTVEELLYGMMLHSGNDAATALALYCGGNLETFVEKMNRKAVQLELSNTSFGNPHGLDTESNYSTAYDLAKLTAYAMENEVFSQVVGTKTVSFKERTFTNHNKLLWRYEGAIGVKTGYTRAAGRILVSCAQREGRRLIAVTINDPNDWQDHARMFDHGFGEFSSCLVANHQELCIPVPVIGGAEDHAIAVLREDLYYPVSKNEQVQLSWSTAPFVYAPAFAGESAGELLVLVDGTVALRAPLYWQHSVLEGA